MKWKLDKALTKGPDGFWHLRKMVRGKAIKAKLPTRDKGTALKRAIAICDAALLGQDQTLKNSLVLGDCHGLCLPCSAEIILGAHKSLLGFLKARMFLCKPFLGCCALNFKRLPLLLLSGQVAAQIPNQGVLLGSFV